MHALIAAVLAANPVQLGNAPNFLGWTKDGAAIAWTQVEEDHVAIGDEGDSALAETATIANVHDVRTGKTQRFPLEVKRLRKDADGALRKKYGAGDRAAFEAWKKGHPLALGKAAPKGADADVTVGGESMLSWSPEGETKVVLVATRAGASAKLAYDDGPAAMFVPQREAETYWDPTGRRVAFVVSTRAAQTMRGVVPANAEVYLVAVPPRAEVVAPARLAAEAAKAADAIEAAGTPVVNVGVATKDRTATVVYANSPHDALAKKLAEGFPGATVDKLTWKPNAEVVVAIGAPAK